MRIPSSLAVALALIAASTAQADTIEVSSITLLNLAKQTRGGVPGQDWNLVSVAPAFEIISITARDVRNGVADDLTFVLSTWASYDIRDRRWDNGTDSDLTGDLVTAYAQGRFIGRRLTLRLGRTQVPTGAARMIQLDGGQAVLLLPAGFRVSAYAGSPVAQRFATRSGFRSWNAVGGDLATGGRVGWSLALPGAPGRGLDLGASVNLVSDGGDPVRQEVGADARVALAEPLVLSAFAAYSLPDERASEAVVRAGWTPTRRLLVEADYRYVAPDLLLSRNSILSVFSAEERQWVGGGATYTVLRGLKVGGSYHLQVEPGATESASNELGNEADARVEWERGRTLAGLEGFVLDAFDNGYVGGRAFGRQELGRSFAALDVLLHRFREEVNGQRVAVTGTLSLGYELAHGFAAVVSGRAGMNPFMEQTFEVMAKLAYNQTYRRTEVR
ncbi:MAG TPA: hypothetical protein VF912_07325 [Anaeromyxobacter sp.]